MILHRLGLDSFIEVFKVNCIDYDAFLGLTDHDMACLKLPIGSRYKIRKEISKINATETDGKFT